MVQYPGNAIPSPTFSRGDVSLDDELLYSTVGFTQKGITLKAGQGVLKLGTPMGQATADKRWYAYGDANADGTQVCRGFLRQTVDTGTDANGAEFQGNLVIAGMVKLSKVTASGVAFDAAAIADLNGRSDAVLDYFSF